MPEPTAYNELNKRWKSTCRILLGGEVGELSEYSKWLYEGNGPRMVQKSGVSGKDVVFASSNYSKNAQWISFDEADLNKKYEPLSINGIKDVDSILQAVSDRVVYAGNIVLGNSKEVEQSTTVTESYYVLHCERTAFCKYIAYCTRGGYSENAFGCYGFGLSQFIVRAMATTNSARCFNVSRVSYSSDVCFSHGATNCSDLVFCFNLKNKRHAIGNLVLPKEKYAQLKAKLLEEIREKLAKDKCLPSLAEMFATQKPEYSELKRAMAGATQFPREKSDKDRIKKAFNETASVVLGTPLGPIDRYAAWLSKNSSIYLEGGKSCATGDALIIPDYAHFLKLPRDRLVTQDEADFIGEKIALSQNGAEGLSLSNAAQLLNGIVYFCPFWLAGNLKNNIDSPMNLDSVDCYRGTLFILSKLCAFCFSPRSCECTFGSREPREMTFCINSHFSTKCSRCFEIDSCSNCTGIYFCHNCENVHDSMFCFNVKNKKYAIGNVEVGREKFLEAKKILLDWAGKELEARGALPLDIYNLADFKAKKSTR
jgi:hypothetical protein